jgi:hypothetical protein
MKKLLIVLALTAAVVTGNAYAQLKVGDWQVQKVGDWQVKPTSTNLVRVPHGTNDTLKTILEWLETNGVYEASDLIRIAPHNVLSLEDDGTLGVAGTVTDKGGGTWGITFPSSSAASNTVFRSQIHGLWGEYAGDTSVTMRAGFTMANGSYFATNSAFTYTFATNGADVSGYDILQVCLDWSVSSPLAPAISLTNVFDSVTAAAYDAEQGGWYCGNDRVLAALPMYEGALVQSWRGTDGRLTWGGTDQITLEEWDWTCTGYWEETTVSSADVLPAGCDETLIMIEGDTYRTHTAQRYWIGWPSCVSTGYYVGDYNTIGPTGAVAALCAPYASMVGEMAWVPCPTNNQFLFLGDNGNYDDCRILIRGWKESR